MATMKAKKRNPADLTGRNNNARKKAEQVLRADVLELKGNNTKLVLALEAHGRVIDQLTGTTATMIKSIDACLTRIEQLEGDSRAHGANHISLKRRHEGLTGEMEAVASHVGLDLGIQGGGSETEPAAPAVGHMKKSRPRRRG